MRVTLSSKEYQEVREKVQLIETILDGELQRKHRNLQRLSSALSATRSIQSKYFPQINYSLYYFRGGHGVGNQSLNRTNYHKWKRLKQLEKNEKLTELTTR